MGDAGKREEKAAILRMVAAGKISVEQGSELLDALEPPAPSGPRPTKGLGELLEEVLAAGLGRRFSESWAGHGPSSHGAARPPRPPRPPRTARAEQRAGGPFSTSTSRPGLSFEDLVELKTQGVPKRYIEDMRDIFPDLGLGELLECSESDIGPDYARGMVDAFGDIDVAQLVEMREAGVTVDFASALRSEFPDLEPSAVVEAAEEGVSIDDLEFFVGRFAPPGDDGEDEPPDGDDPDGWEGPPPA
jgi:SHOCT-like domain